MVTVRYIEVRYFEKFSSDKCDLGLGLGLDGSVLIVRRFSSPLGLKCKYTGFNPNLDL